MCMLVEKSKLSCRFCRYAGCESTLTVTPLDVSVVRDSQFRLNCSTSDTSKPRYPTWTFTNETIAYPGQQIFYQNATLPQFSSSFSIARSYPPGKYDLIGLSADAAQCGTYTCIDQGGVGPADASADVIVYGESMVILLCHYRVGINGQCQHEINN